MKNIKITAIVIASVLSVAALLSSISCEKETIEPNQPQALARKGGGKGNGGNNSPTTGNSTGNAYLDSLYSACGMVLTDSGLVYPTVQINNIVSTHNTSYSYDPVTGGYTHPYDNVIITFTAPTIPGKTIQGYQLWADQCSQQTNCFWCNGVYQKQITTQVATTTFILPIGITMLNPSLPSYTGFIHVATTDGCIYISQPFTFTPPRYL